jgi:nitrogen fixation protein NifQ
MAQSLPGAHTMPADTVPSLPTLPSPASRQTQDLDEVCAIRIGQWMAGAINGRSCDTALFAKLIAAREVRNGRSLLGLSETQWRGLVSRHFRVAPDGFDAVSVSVSVTRHEHVEFVAAMRALLLQSVSPAVSLDDAQCLASIIAHACLRPDHLWRDLGLAGRHEVSAMLERYFPSLVALNVENLRWKKFLARQLALSLGQEPGPAPGCPGCEDYGYCFPHAT